MASAPIYELTQYNNMLWIVIIMYGVVILYSIYMAYIGYRQAKVYKQMNKVIVLLTDIKGLLKRKKL